ncbi:MAG: hemG [Acidimicrobiaceae bacterium]|nr:hemG [Acidimicrobiaceae bacterium]
MRQVPRVLVVGAGVAGLVAARQLAGRYEVVLLERERRAGGKLVTSEFRGRPLDLGPDNFITRNDAAERLCREIGLGDDLLAPATSSAAVFARGLPRPLPKGLVLGVPTDLGALRRSGIVGPGAVLRAAADLVLPRSRASMMLAARLDGGAGDPTVAEVVRPRLGAEVLGALVDPLIGGINAGDSARLSFAAAAPSLASAAAGRRSLLRALRPRPSADPRGEDGSASPHTSPLFLGLQGGLGTLVARLVLECERAGVDVRLDTGVNALERCPAGAGSAWVLRCASERLEADGVVLALPAPGAAELLGTVSPVLARECGDIAYAGVATVTLAWPDRVVPAKLADLLGGAHSGARGLSGGDHSSVSPAGTSAILPGSGVLIPRSSGHLVTAATFTSTKWPRSANPGEVVVRASVGRDGDDRSERLDDDELVRRVRDELSSILGITAAPLETVVQRWPASFPQYVTGHLDRGTRIRRLATSLPALALAGAGYEGIGIPACIASGERAAAAVDLQLCGR